MRGHARHECKSRQVFGVNAVSELEGHEHADGEEGHGHLGRVGNGKRQRRVGGLGWGMARPGGGSSGWEWGRVCTPPQSRR